MRVFDLTNLLEQVVKASGQESSLIVFIATSLNPSLDGVSLAWAGLSVSKNRAVVALEALVNDGLADLYEDFLLLHVFSTHEVEAEGLPTVQDQALLLLHLAHTLAFHFVANA